MDKGDTLTLKCSVIGDPQLEIKWYRNGQLLKPSNRILIENQPNGDCSIIVKNCLLNDEGIYRCEAENLLGRASTQCTTHVDSKHLFIIKKIHVFSANKQK